MPRTDAAGFCSLAGALKEYSRSVPSRTKPKEMSRVHGRIFFPLGEFCVVEKQSRRFRRGRAVEEENEEERGRPSEAENYVQFVGDN